MDLGLRLYRRANLPRSRRIDCRWIAAAGLAIFVAVVMPAARAAPIEFHYGGVITSADDGTGITPGERFEGAFTYDPQINPNFMSTDSGSTDSGRFYWFAQPVGWPGSPPPDTSALSLSIGGRLVFSQQGGLDLGVTDVGVNDPLNLHPYSSIWIISTEVDTNRILSLRLAGGQPGALDIPTGINLADFTDSSISGAQWGSTDGTSPTYQGTIDTLVRVTTPEPASVALWLGLGIAAWAVKARSRGRA
jgi:hypothetical protein